MNQPSFGSSDFSSSTALQGFMQRVYQWMAAGLALTGFVALMAASNMGLMRALAGGGFLVLMLAELGLVFGSPRPFQKFLQPRQWQVFWFIPR